MVPILQYIFQWSQKCPGKIRPNPLLIGLPDPDPLFRITGPDPKEIFVDPQHWLRIVTPPPLPIATISSTVNP
jgi:hypothetical protein